MDKKGGKPLIVKEMEMESYGRCFGLMMESQKLLILIRMKYTDILDEGYGKILFQNRDNYFQFVVGQKIVGIQLMFI